MRILIVCIVILTLSGCAVQPNVASNRDKDDTRSESARLLEQGYQQLAQRNTQKAIEDYFNKVIAQCEAQYSDAREKVYASRSATETIYYMLKAAADDQPAVAVGTTCADALYLKGYASLDLGEVETAEEYVNRAIEMSPVNAIYLSELGHIYQVKRDWDNALATFRKAEEAAKTYSPEQVRNDELARAKRGVGYSLIELGRLDDAEVKFRECLEINDEDTKAKHELKYIRGLRETSP